MVLIRVHTQFVFASGIAETYAAPYIVKLYLGLESQIKSMNQNSPDNVSSIF